jgi:hypothetical protein
MIARFKASTLLLICSGLLAFTFTLLSLSRVFADGPSFQASQIMDGANLTAGNTSFVDPVSADKDDEVS